MSNLPAILTAAAGLVAAVAALIAQWRHVNGPAHNPPSSPPGAADTPPK
jgi:hypothetical protein